MVKIQIDLNEEENRAVEIYKALAELDNKELAIKHLINKFIVKKDKNE